jgi:hypothetical protein
MHGVGRLIWIAQQSLAATLAIACQSLSGVVRM